MQDCRLLALTKRGKDKSLKDKANQERDLLLVGVMDPMSMSRVPLHNSIFGLCCFQEKLGQSENFACDN